MIFDRMYGRGWVMTMGDVEISDISDGPVNKHGQGQAKMAAPALLLVLRDRMMDRSSAH